MKLALIGFPLGHSFSKAYFEQKWKHENRQAQYLNIEIQSLTSQTWQVLMAQGLDGFNVTLPHKQSIIPFLDNINPIALQIGAVNCVQQIQSKWIGHNTDVLGIKHILKPYLKTNHKALLLGTGGSSKAVQYVLNKYKNPYTLIGRNTTISYKHITKKMLQEHILVINTTPLGMFPEVNNMPLIPYTYLTEKHICFDLIYNPQRTLFLRYAEEKGATCINGLELLYLQAEESWKIWNRTT